MEAAWLRSDVLKVEVHLLERKQEISNELFIFAHGKVLLKCSSISLSHLGTSR